MGDFDVGYDRDRSSLTFTGPYGKSYFFIFEKLDKVYKRGNIPRYSRDDAVKFAEKHETFRIRPDLTLADYWKTSTSFTLVPTEEGTYKIWTWGRIACAGDASAKMTPNIGAGGNCGIESAAALANAIKAIANRSHGERPSEELIKEELKSYQKKREKRAAAIVKTAGEVTRMQAMASLRYRFQDWLFWLYPGDYTAEILGDYFVDAEMLVRSPHYNLESNSKANNCPRHISLRPRRL